MLTERRFCRFTPLVEGYESSIHQISAGGFCLSAFVILSPRGHPESVLLGKADPTAPWDRLASWTQKMRESSSRRWVIPSSHLLYGESPRTAAERILAEQLPEVRTTLVEPVVLSEQYSPAGRPEWKDHWDLSFLFRGEADGLKSTPPIWRELEYLEVSSLRREEFARSHEDVLASVGLRPGGG